MGQRMSMEDITGESSYTYDSLERLKTATNGSGKVVEYYYDEANNLSGILYPDGYDVQYEYDLNDNITKIIDRDRRDTVYEYDPLNRITKTIRADGTYSEFVYNARNQILKVENFCGCGFSISSYEYTYDDAGQIVAETAVECLDTTNKDYSHVGGGNDECAHKQTNPWMNQNPSRQTTKRTFEYDDNGELIGCIEDKRQSDGQFWKYAYTYEYDEVGNRTMAKKRNCNVGGNPDVTTYEYNADNQMVSAVVCEKNTTKPYKFTYDANGNLTKECFHLWPEVTYHYDTENRLKAVYNTRELLMAAVYDGDGNKTFQLNYNTGATCGYGKNLSGEVYIPEHNKNEDGTLTAEGELFSYIGSATGRAYDLTEYVNDTTQKYTQVLEAYTINSGATEAYSYGNGRLSRNNYWIEARGVVHNEESYYLYDGRGSVTANTWYNGMVTDVYQYDPYGQVTLGSTKHTEFYGYNAESYNPNTGLEYLRARYYNPNKGRFFQEDSYLGEISDPLTLNRYAYTKNSPLNYIDPSGHSAIGLTNRLVNLKGSLKNKIRSSIEKQSSIEIIPGVLSVSMQEAIAMGEMTDCDLDEMASGILGMITELSYYMGYLGLGLLMPPAWCDLNEIIEGTIEGPIANGILNAESYYSGKAGVDRFIATLGKSLDGILWNTVSDLTLLLGMIGQGGSGSLAGALSGGGSISVESGAIAVTIGEGVIIAVVGAVTVAGGSQILQSEGNKNASKNQEKADKAAEEGPSPEEILGIEHANIGNPRGGLNDKIAVVNGAQSEARYLTKAEKTLAIQILDDINDYINLGDSNAYQRLVNNGLHTLSRDYAGWESVYIDPTGSGGISNNARILFKQTSDGVEWMVKIFH